MRVIQPHEASRIVAFLKSGPEMVRYLEEHAHIRFKPVPLPDYHVSQPGASVGHTIRTEAYDGRVLGRLTRDIRYPIQGSGAFGSLAS
ncbi:hypothetical protein GB937_006114 [Aspergillus fischeri]|nr:hypothetical protein GB937_006114 [Aspergillus fischeri]